MTELPPPDQLEALMRERQGIRACACGIAALTVLALMVLGVLWLFGIGR